MEILVLGLILFLGTHSARIVAEDGRKRAIARWGEGAWKGLYSVLSLLGFALIVWGFARARQQPVVLWAPPAGLKHLNALFTLLAFILLAATYLPRNQIKARLHHPMVLGVMLWALGHLLATATLADALLFAAFLLWAALSWRAARQRDRALATVYPPGRLAATLATLLVGVLAWVAFAFWLHAAWIGVAPFARTL
ncbi:MAG TPA: NnrU family protein [Ottowia sp.]|uniref:NnrU family protein n=1 Tax=Ottowia sp. TaxID=1898956 RepID=UPI002C5402AE|nr:NnrU family protein [Ottowia sp.]HMN21918.1 NnrU family protein [Ottowia sp.]